MSIRSLRQQAGKTQREVAAALSVAERTFIRWEQGDAEPDAGNLLNLLDYFRKETGNPDLEPRQLLGPPAPEPVDVAVPEPEPDPSGVR